MTKRELYAFALSVARRAVWGIAPILAVARPAAAQPAPCAACLAIVVAPAQSSLLPSRLDGLDLFVTLSDRHTGPAIAMMAEIARRGGRPGLLTEGETDIPAEAAARAVAILLDLTRVEAAGDGLAFALKSRLTALRSATAGKTRLGIVASPEVIAGLNERGVGAYTDVVVSAGGPAPRSGSESWRAVARPVPELTDIASALAEAASDAAVRWLWWVPSNRVAAAAVLADLAAAASNPLGEGVDVVGVRRLAVEEIVARHQAAAARQRSAVRTLVSTGQLTVSFEAPGFPAPVTITAATTLYASADRTELAERDIRVNGIAFDAGRVPRLPIIEPERVSAPPLTITLTNLYRYRLADETTSSGRRCYVVDFEPRQRGARLFRGRAWIEAGGFNMIRVEAAQEGLRGPIVSSEQVDEFREASPGIWLLARSDVRQRYEGAGHRTPIHRVLTITSDEIDPPDFAEQRANAYASSAVMIRDTPQGYRYLDRESRAATSAAGAPGLAGRATRIRTVAGGVIVDPNISRPLPFAGLSYVDFDVAGTGAELNLFFGGSYGQIAYSMPSVGGSRWQFGGQAFGIASAFNDRAFEKGREQYDQNLSQRPAHASVWLVRPLTPRFAARVGYDLDYTHLAGSDATADGFVVPADQVVHAARFALDAQRSGWQATAWWNPARRAAWRPWGYAGGEYRARHADFQRYGASLVRAAVLSPHVTTRVEAAWMAGHDLDRFSRYAFGTFENRLRGYPSALIRYDRGAVARTAVAWSASRQARLDGFFDVARVRDPGFGPTPRALSGVGAAVEAPLGFGTLIAVEWSYGFQGLTTSGRQGTHVLRVTGYRVF